MTNAVGQNMYRVVNEIQFYSTFVGVFESVLIYVTFTKHNFYIIRENYYLTHHLTLIFSAPLTVEIHKTRLKNKM